MHDANLTAASVQLEALSPAGLLDDPQAAITSIAQTTAGPTAIVPQR
jgi:hypothetical protein